MRKTFFEFLLVFVVAIWLIHPKFIFDTIIPMYVGHGSLFSFFAALIVVWGVSFTFWGFIGLVRLTIEKTRLIIPERFKKEVGPNVIRKDEVAVLMAAHNEELVIADSLSSLLNITKNYNIFIVSDNSNDRTVEIARQYGANVLDLIPGKGKAGALETGMYHFKIPDKYKAVIIVDADTRLKSDYLDKALPLFNDPEVIAVAGYARTIWTPEKWNWKQLLFVSHRDRVYFIFQRMIKFGQTWKYTNVTHIIPGFASTYRTSIIPALNMNPAGLVIEDFNMTFEVHHKKLGIVAHDLSVVAYTQDPDNARDYYRQIKRWHLGFWQTIRLHGFWWSKFWIAMTFTLIESVLGSLTFLMLPIFFIISLLPPSLFNLTTWPWFLETDYLLLTILIGVWLSDYLLTAIVALFEDRKEYLLVGLLFPAVRVIDGVAFLFAIPRAFLLKSNGKWVSPTRRVS